MYRETSYFETHQYSNSFELVFIYKRFQSVKCNFFLFETYLGGKEEVELEVFLGYHAPHSD